MQKIIDQEINNLVVDETWGVFDCWGAVDFCGVFEDFFGETIAPDDVFGEVFGDEFGDVFGDAFGDTITTIWHSLPENPEEQEHEFNDVHFPFPEQTAISDEFFP